MSWITAPFSWLLKTLYNLTSNYGLAVILFAVVVNLILFPFMAKSKKSMMRTARLTPKLKELERKYNGNQQKYQLAVNKLYHDEKINPMSGCLWSLIPFPILIALYSVIRQPLMKMMNLSKDVVETLTAWVSSAFSYTVPADAYSEIHLANALHEHWDAVAAEFGSRDFFGRLMDLDYSFLGLNLGAQPNFRIWQYDWSSTEAWLPALGLFMIPILAAFLSWLSMKISMKTTPQTGQQKAPGAGMMLMMPIMSIFICFTMPAALGLYWIMTSVIGILRDIVLTKIFSKQLHLEDLAKEENQKKEEIERRREERERLRAAGDTEMNPNTSKKRIQANQKQQQDERKAALERDERAARRERLGVEMPEQPASQIGNRRYARGRAYSPERFDEYEAAPSESAE